MRLASSLLATLALISSIPVLVPRRAEACGGYDPTPRMAVVSRHHNEMFVLLEHSVPDAGKVKWQSGGAQFAYDPAWIARAPSLTQAVKVTLAGPAGVRTVSTSRRAYVANDRFQPSAMLALEVAATPSNFEIAVLGERDVTWTELTPEESSPQARAWAVSQHLAAHEVHASRLPAAPDTEILTAFVDGVEWTYVGDGKGAFWATTGTPQGVVTVEGMRYVAIVHDGLVTPIAI